MTAQDADYGVRLIFAVVALMCLSLAGVTLALQGRIERHDVRVEAVLSAKVRDLSLALEACQEDKMANLKALAKACKEGKPMPDIFLTPDDF